MISRHKNEIKGEALELAVGSAATQALEQTAAENTASKELH